MAATINQEFARWVSHDVVGGNVKQFGIYQVILDSSYPTGGEAVDFTALAPYSAVDAVLLVGVDAGGYVIEYDESAGKLVAYEAGADAAALDEVANATDLSAVTVNVLVIGDE